MHLLRFLWFNKSLIVDNSYVNFSTKNMNIMSDLVNENSNFKRWETLKRISFISQIIFSMDAMDSRNPTNLETKNK